MEKTSTMNRVLCTVLTAMLMLALVPTYAFAAEGTNYDDQFQPEVFELSGSYDSKTELYTAMVTITNPTDVTFNKIIINVTPMVPALDYEDITYIDSESDDYFLTHRALAPYTTETYVVASWHISGEALLEDLMVMWCANDVSGYSGGAEIDYFRGHSDPYSEIVTYVAPVEDEEPSDNSTITIETEASTINVTVPTDAAFIFKSDGTNVYPSNYEITNNNGLTAITLDAIDFEGINGWSLTTEDDVFQADAKKFALKMGLKDGDLSAVDKADGAAFSGNTEIKIAPNGSKKLGFEAKRGVFSSPVTTENAMQMTMHFDWEHAA